MEALGPVLVVVAIPLLFRLIPPNRVYGLRVPATLRNRSVWYDANALNARHVIMLGVVLMAMEFVVPRAWWHAVIGSTAVIGLLAIVVSDWRTANRWERERRVAR